MTREIPPVGAALASFTVRSSARIQFIDITDQVGATVRRAGAGDGFALVRCPHTTAAVACTEPDPALLEDATTFIQDLLPLSRRYRHLEEGPENARAHLAALLLGSSTWAPVSAGQLRLGTWQRLFFVELFGPRVRRVEVAFVPASEPPRDAQ